MLDRRIRTGFVWAVMVASISITPSITNAQQSIRGVIAELGTAGRIARATVWLLDADSAVHAATVSDSSGEFEIAVQAPGRYILRGQRIGYISAESDIIDVPANHVVEVRINLRPDPLMLEAVTVYGEMPHSREIEGFYTRRSQHRGYNFTRADFERMSATDMSHVLSEIPSGRIHGTTPRNRKVTLNFNRCEPAVFIDGREWQLGFLDLAEGLPLSTVYGIEVFTTQSDTPGEFASPRWHRARCGVIVVWTWAVERR
jgi:hypothetical protein